MIPHVRITSSWDDGHPLDLKVGELLAKHGVRGTFYVPKHSEHETMSPAQIRDLGSSFELGAHTLNHVYLTRATDAAAWHEISGAKLWLEDQLGISCPLFCPPRGGFADRHLAMMRNAGYIGLRSVELCSLDSPRRRAGLLVMPTTLQAHPHRIGAFSRNMIKRVAVRNFWWFVFHGRSTDWPTLAGSFMQHVLIRGGVFHLWGHSWELQEAGQWSRLEEVLRLMGDCAKNGATSFTNGEICQQSLSQPASAVQRTEVLLPQPSPCGKTAKDIAIT